MEIRDDSHYHTALDKTGYTSDFDVTSKTSVESQMKIRAITAILAIALTVSLRPAAAEGDPETGRQLGFTCMGCHGIEGQRNAYPSFRVPKLGGQNSEYLQTALEAYRAGTRPHPTMQAQSGSMTDSDIEDLVAWLSASGSVSDTATAEQVAGVSAAEICVTCHGAQGQNVQPAPPILAGQHADYLVHALKQYKDMSRGGNVMTAFAATLNDADIELLANFYASQEGLQTLD